MSCSAALFSGLFLAVSVATLVLLRVRIVFVDTIYAVLSHRQRQHRRVAAGLDDEDPRTQSRRMQAWSHGAEGFTSNGRRGGLHENRRDEDLLAWATALSERDARPRPGGENMGGGGGRGRPMYIRPFQLPQEPAPISLPEHLLRESESSKMLLSLYCYYRRNTDYLLVPACSYYNCPQTASAASAVILSAPRLFVQRSLTTIYDISLCRAHLHRSQSAR